MFKTKKERVLWSIGTVLSCLIILYVTEKIPFTSPHQEPISQEQLKENMGKDLKEKIVEIDEVKNKLVDSLKSNYSITLPVYYYFKQNKPKFGSELFGREDLWNQKNIIIYLKNEHNLNDYNSDTLINVMEYVLNSKTEEELSTYYKTGLQIIEATNVYHLFPEVQQSNKK
ncbi:MAG: hypothetical protein FWC39_04315 [Bacteroidetes bacterium]|nr:hypothetical protein [Bacteroidota bacterium]